MINDKREKDFIRKDARIPFITFFLFSLLFCFSSKLVARAFFFFF